MCSSGLIIFNMGIYYVQCCLKLCQGQGRRYNTNRLHRETKVPLLRKRRKAHTLNFMYKRKENRRELLNNREIRTRAHDAPTFNIAIPRCEAFKRSVGYHGSEEWNSLPPDIRNIESYQKFKERQKRDMLLGLANLV